MEGTGGVVIAVTICGALLTFLLGIIAFLLKSQLSGIAERLHTVERDLQESKISDTTRDHEARMDIGKLRHETSEQYVKEDVYSRDYVTLSNKVDVAHRRIDELYRMLTTKKESGTLAQNDDT